MGFVYSRPSAFCRYASFQEDYRNERQIPQALYSASVTDSYSFAFHSLKVLNINTQIMDVI